MSVKILTRSHDLIQCEARDYGERLEQTGFDGAQLVLHKALLNHSGYNDEFSEGELDTLRESLSKVKVKACILGCYRDLGNPELNEENLSLYTRYFEYAERLGIGCVATETGLDALDEEVIRARHGHLLSITHELVMRAKDKGLTLLLEMVRHYPLNSAKICLELLAQNPTGLGFIFDLSNLVYESDVSADTQHRIIDEYLANPELKPYILGVHLKDFVVSGSDRQMCPLGEGVLDYAYLKPALLALPALKYMVREWERSEWAQADLSFMRKLLA
ncbi:MAG: sugar phosphate isomerase/epimerase [Succinivibrio sp.]|nr:sugar phosphate isomerase/epimerase [Succinivibrio sp.]